MTQLSLGLTVLLQALRIISVLDGVLADRDYLVGNKPSAADIVFFPWDSALNYVFGDSGLDSELANYKNFTRWHESIKNHPVVRKTWALREKVIADVDVPSAKK
jgi:glutathione S-transferase